MQAQQKKIKGNAYTTPSGERRIRLVDLNNAKDKKDVYEITLADILLTGATIEGPEDQEIRLKPLNLKGLSALTRLYGNDLKALAGAQLDFDQVIKITTVLVNQDRSPDEHLDEDTVGRLVTVQLLPIINELVVELINPLFAPAAANTQSPTTGA